MYIMIIPPISRLPCPLKKNNPSVYSSLKICPVGSLVLTGRSPVHRKVNKIIQQNTYEFNVLTGSESHAIQQRQKRNQDNVNQ